MSRKDYDNVIYLKDRRLKKKYSIFYSLVHKIRALLHITKKVTRKKKDAV